MTDDDAADAAPSEKPATITINSTGLPLKDVAIFVYDASNESCASAARKLHGAHPGSVIGMTAEELKAIRDPALFCRFVL